MRETHPIDELFREKLQNASATPPAHIAEAVLGAVRTKRRAALWRRSATALLLLLLLVGGGAAWNALRTKDQRASARPEVEQQARNSTGATISPEEHSVVTVETSVGATATKHTDEPDPSGEASTSPNSISTSGSPVDRFAAARSPANNGEARRDPVVPSAPAVLTSKPDPAIPPQVMPPFENVAGLFVRESVSVGRMSAISTDRSVQPAPESAALHTGPVLPNGEWWIAPSVGIVASQYSWSGGADELVAALDRNSGWSSDFAIGLFGGRSWRSGLVLSGGIEWQRSEQLFRSTERVTTVENTAVDIVTLNTQVIAADTTWAVVEQMRTSEGTDRRSVLRVPLELAWHQGMRRWFAGPRVGVAGELTRASSNSSLVWNEEDGRVRAEAIDSDAMCQRYPFAVLGVVGVDLGFLVNERLSIVTAPSYSLTLLDLGHASETHATAERLGLRLQLRHTF